MYLAIENFRAALDTRRSVLTAQPGSLSTLQDGHINQGAEIEKRKAFVKVTLPTGTFGGLDTPTGIMVFGSIPTPAGLPSPFVYQRLQHPNGQSIMTGVVSAELFAGKAFVIATYDNGETEVFFNGMLDTDFTSGVIQSTLNTLIGTEIVGRSEDVATIVTAINHGLVTGAIVTISAISDASFNAASVVITVTDTNIFTYANPGPNVDNFFDTTGLVTGSPTNARIAAALVALTNQTQGYSASQLPSPNDNKFDLTGNPGLPYSTTITIESAAGSLTDTVNSGVVEAVTAQAAVGQFQIMAGSFSAGVNKITSIQVHGVELLGASIDWNVSNQATALVIADYINSNPVVPVYTATANGAVVVISALPAAGTTPDGFVLQVTAVGNVCIGNSQLTFGLTTAGGGGDTITNIKANSTEILGATIAFATTLAALVTAVAAQINSGTGTHGYQSFASGVVLFLSKKITASSDSDVIITPTVTGNLQVSGGTTPVNPIALVATVVVVSRTQQTISPNGHASQVQTTLQLQCVVTGGVPPYTFNWQLTNNNGVWANTTNPNNSTCTFVSTGNTSTFVTFSCIVLDTNQQSVTAFILVSQRNGLG